VTLNFVVKIRLGVTASSYQSLSRSTSDVQTRMSSVIVIVLVNFDSAVTAMQGTEP
jgi:hypothetical protein